MEQTKGYFVISLDFELFWGMFDKHTIESYGKRIVGEKTAIPRMLALFSAYGIHATWATVGMLMARDKEELLALLPPVALRPEYENPKISAYRYLETTHIGENENDDPYHFGGSLMKMILNTPHQYIGNHTFSHYYCVDGQHNPPEKFAADIDAFNKVAESYGISATSIVFPRNQSSAEALQVCAAKGIMSYRGNEDHFLYRPRKDKEQHLFIRALRLLDHYLNLTGYHTYALPQKQSGLVNVKASRFLRPWSKSLRFLESLRMRRIKNAMTHAAKCGKIFHLWWHPHNFGIDQEENLKNLTELLEHFKRLQKQFGMQSASMEEIAKYASEQPV